MNHARRICLVDDNTEFRDSAAWWLEGLGYEVSAFETPAACLDTLAADPVLRGEACLLLDVRMPEMSGLQLLDALRARGVDRPVIFMTGHGDVPLAVEAMRKGALTFLEKPFQEAALEQALRLAFEAPQAVTPQDAAPAIEPTPRGGDPEYLRRLERLTPREREVFDLVVRGHPNKVVAVKLGVTAKTVEFHRARMMSKMQAASFSQLVRMALAGGVDG